MKSLFHGTKWLWLLCILMACSDKEEEKINIEKYTYAIPANFPKMDIPADNQPTKERIALGKMLFFDPILSKTNNISCGSCHFQKNAFADHKALSIGVNDRKGTRNSPTLANIGYHIAFFADGGVPSLELQVIAPIENPLEMDLPIDSAIARLNQNKDYVDFFQLAYGRNPDLFSLIRAIACFERTLLSGNSIYDQAEQGKLQLTSSELRGKQLFFSDSLNCSQCHGGFNFTHFAFENNGLYQNYDDKGRQNVTVRPQDEGKFKVPSLRNIELTAPYMHDGSFENLEKVIEHYENGGQKHKNQSNLIQGFSLSKEEKQDLINFLKTLTDITFTNN